MTTDYDAQAETVDGLMEATGLRYNASQRWEDDGATVVELRRSAAGKRCHFYRITPCGALAELIRVEGLAW